jgi:hypothetical protein
MKNIHVLPTDKPSRLYKTGNFLLLDSKAMPNNTLETMNQHIYITSDEEIKDRNCWVTNGVEIFKPSDLPEYSLEYANRYWEKIILTTDPDLIKDGVQPIDDEFLEWFVKNPSCESVEVEKYHGINTSIAEVNYIAGDGSLNWQGKNDLRDYKIIIPKEEPKQTAQEYEQQGMEKYAHEFKQETLEEAAERLYPNGCDGTDRSAEIYRRILIEGAKLQAERMYSEEDLLSAFEAGMMFIGEDKGSFREWFEEFKKK